jgi:hypothetical protein
MALILDNWSPKLEKTNTNKRVLLMGLLVKNGCMSGDRRIF